MNQRKTIWAGALMLLGLTVSTGFSADLKEFKFGQILAMTGSGS